MVAIVGSLAVSLRADQSQFSGALRAAGIDVSAFESRTARSLANIDHRSSSAFASISRSAGLGAGALARFTTSVVGPIAGLLTLTAAISGTRSALEKFSTIADQSAAAGVDSEFFQSIAYQAKLAGVEIDAVAGGLASFAKNAGLAAEGKGRMVSQLAALNPMLLQNIQLATTQEQRIRLVADAIASATDPAQAAAIASATLGEAGVKLVAAFQGGAARIDEMMEKAKALGIVVSRDVIARADELGDQLDTVTQIADNNLKVALVNLGPVLVGLTGLVADWSRSLSIVLDQLRQVEERTYLNPLQNKLVELENLRAPLMEDLRGLKEQLAELDPSSGMAGVIAGEIEQKAARAEELMQQALEYQERIAQLQGKPTGTATPATTPPADLANLNLPDAGKVDQVATGFRNVAKAAEQSAVAIASSADAVDHLREQFALAEDLAKGFAHDLIGDLRSGVSAVDALSNAFNRLGDRLIDMALDQAINALFANLLGTGLGAIGGTGVGTGLTGPATYGGTGGIFGVPGFDTGGWTGSSSGVAGFVHPEEFVVKQGPAAHYRPMLEAMNAGKFPAGGGNNVNVQIIRYPGKPGEQDRVETSQRADGGMDIKAFIVDVVTQAAGARGSQLNRLLRTGFGASNPLTER